MGPGSDRLLNTLSRRGVSDAVTLHATHTHLFPDARLSAADGPFPADPAPVHIVFHDAEADADLLPGEADGGRHLAVDAYRTTAGQDTPVKRWRIRHVETGVAGTETGVVGMRLP
jgi:hypothetical protein